MALNHRAAAALLLLISISSLACAHGGYNQGGHSYSKTCPDAEKIIQDTVNNFYYEDRSIPAGIIRLFFHDCFVNGCDASILLESNSDGSDTERNARPNKGSVRGFEVILEAKRRLEAACPRTVSCADTLAIAARDSTVKMGGQYYSVPTGRYDGKVSSIALAEQNLPAPSFSNSELIKNFKDQGLSAQDLVVLSGGHTIGTSKCTFASDRIYNFSNTGRADPSINPSYLAYLRSTCPPGSNPAPRVELDKGSEFSFDNSYYKNLVNGKGLLNSDQVLTQSQSTSGLVRSLAYNPKQFGSLFGQSMIRMGNIGWKTKHTGEIRRVCSAVNSKIRNHGKLTSSSS